MQRGTNESGTIIDLVPMMGAATFCSMLLREAGIGARNAGNEPLAVTLHTSAGMMIIAVGYVLSKFATNCVIPEMQRESAEHARITQTFEDLFPKGCTEVSFSNIPTSVKGQKLYLIDFGRYSDQLTWQFMQNLRKSEFSSSLIDTDGTSLERGTVYLKVEAKSPLDNRLQNSVHSCAIAPYVGMV